MRSKLVIYQYYKDCNECRYYSGSADTEIGFSWVYSNGSNTTLSYTPHANGILNEKGAGIITANSPAASLIGLMKSMLL